MELLINSLALIFVFIFAGIKFMVVTDPKLSNQDTLLKRLHEIYADFALKNPFYSIDMPIRYLSASVILFVPRLLLFGYFKL